MKIGDRLKVQRIENRWIASDEQGQLGVLRWLPSQDGKVHAVTGTVVRLPSSGILHVQRLVIDPDGCVKDIGGYVQPD